MLNDPDSYHGDGNAGDEAREDFDFEAGEQLNEEDKAILQDVRRPIVFCNCVGTTIDSVAGQEVGNRQKLQFSPRTLGVVKKNERRRRPRTAAILFSADPRVRSAAAGIRDNPFSSRIIR